ncbi:hypothetical protein HGRIS_006851 [Hohenbuehelia grisea]|uniref:Uncharacterized protein n=1 Tax=Hohenbuehelia grisea TaxID=104357 RepID=A0ABR3JAM9_9AGAR
MNSPYSPSSLLQVVSLLPHEDTMEYSLKAFSSRIDHIPDLHQRLATAHSLNMSERRIPPATGLILGILATVKYHSENNTRNTMPTIMGVASSSPESQTYAYTPSPGLTPAQRRALCEYRVKLNPKSCQGLSAPRSVNYTAGNCVEWETIITEIRKSGEGGTIPKRITASSRGIRGHQAERCFCDLCSSYVRELLQNYPDVIVTDAVSGTSYVPTQL